MYGNGTAAVDRTPGAQAPVEQLSSIHDTTIKNLSDAAYALDQLLAKVRGSQPSKGEPGLVEKLPERYLLNDAYAIRALASRINDQVGELHRIIGHEK